MTWYVVLESIKMLQPLIRRLRLDWLLTYTHVKLVLVAERPSHAIQWHSTWWTVRWEPWAKNPELDEMFLEFYPPLTAEQAREIERVCLENQGRVYSFWLLPRLLLDIIRRIRRGPEPTWAPGGVCTSFVENVVRQGAGRVLTGQTLPLPCDFLLSPHLRPCGR